MLKEAIKKNWELVAAGFFLIFGASSNKLTWWMSEWMVGHMNCQPFVKAEGIRQWLNGIMQAPCDFIEGGIEWIIHYPLLLMCYYICYWGFVNSLLAKIVNIIAPKLLLKLPDVFSVYQLFIVSGLLGTLISWFTPLNEWFEGIYIYVNGL